MNNTLLDTVAACSKDLMKFGFSVEEFATCTLHQMYYDYGGKTTVGFCGTKGVGMGKSLIGQTWGTPQAISDPTVKMMMAYYHMALAPQMPLNWALSIVMMSRKAWASLSRLEPV